MHRTPPGFAPTEYPVSPPAGEAGFSAAQCEALFQAILIDDVVDPQTKLPAGITLDYPADVLADCFGLCRQLWRSGFDHSMIAGMTIRLVLGGTLDDAERRRFKDVRAKFKHFRYAYRLYTTQREVPPLFDRVTIAMGKLQDAMRNGRRGATIGHALMLRLMVLAPSVHRMKREADAVTLADPASFRAMFEDDRARLAALLAQDAITGRELHAGRKIIGRQVSFYDTLRTLTGGEDAYDMSRSLSAINGLMGDLHDRLVEEKLVDPTAYDNERFAMPTDIAQRLSALVERFDA